MPPLKSVLKRSQVETAQRQRTCHHDPVRKILKGETCLVLFDGEREKYCYCKETALKMITEARRQLDELATQLTSETRPVGYSTPKMSRH